MREIILAAKYRPWVRVDEWFEEAGCELGRALSKEVAGILDKVDIVPMPSPSLRKWKGMLITPAIARGVRRAMVESGVQARNLQALSMPLMSASQRGRNQLKRANRKMRMKLSPSAAVVLVDDVVTTGATLQTAAEVLASKGFPAVAAITVAKAHGALKNHKA
ncbi:MAG: phosphoribosyltransferase family protein [Actinomycetaceae bacterium]|nr:phosphoribosyltransferase family protein [Actinomycetaceae bacterium]